MILRLFSRTRFVFNALQSRPLLHHNRYTSHPNSSTHVQIFARNFCNRDNNNQWTQEIDYLDESGSVIFTGKGVRSVEPGVDDHIMVGDLKQPFSNASAVAKIVEIVKRWKWGPEMETQLDKLQFTPNMIHITQAIKLTGDADTSLSLFRWANSSSQVVASMRINPLQAFEWYYYFFSHILDVY